MKIDRFVIALLAAVVVAYLFPDFGTGEPGKVLGNITNVGVSLIFFFYGLKLSPDKIKSGLSNWRLHVLVQVSSFILFPVLVLIAYPFISSESAYSIWLGFFFLAALPSTVSSSVVMVSIARGNIPAAIFNASISGIIGIVITPLWMGLFLHQQGDFDFTSIYLKLLLEILLPVVAGIMLQRRGHKLVMKYLKQLSLFDKTIILLIIYKSFSSSFKEKMFSGIGAWELVSIFGFVLLLFTLSYTAIYYIGKAMKFNTEDHITALFCGSKKSLVHGTVFSKVLFGQMAGVGIYLLPLMLFHAMQILIVSVIAGRYAKRITNG